MGKGNKVSASERLSVNACLNSAIDEMAKSLAVVWLVDTMAELLATIQMAEL